MKFEGMRALADLLFSMFNGGDDSFGGDECSVRHGQLRIDGSQIAGVAGEDVMGTQDEQRPSALCLVWHDHGEFPTSRLRLTHESDRCFAVTAGCIKHHVQVLCRICAKQGLFEERNAVGADLAEQYDQPAAESFLIVPNLLLPPGAPLSQRLRQRSRLLRRIALRYFAAVAHCLAQRRRFRLPRRRAASIPLLAGIGSLRGQRPTTGLPARTFRACSRAARAISSCSSRSSAFVPAGGARAGSSVVTMVPPARRDSFRLTYTASVPRSCEFGRKRGALVCRGLLAGEAEAAGGDDVALDFAGAGGDGAGHAGHVGAAEAGGDRRGGVVGIDPL